MAEIENQYITVIILFFIFLACFCGKNTQDVPCRANVTDTYSCNNICNKPLDCEKHYCQKICHSEACEPCSLTPERVTMCCCGQTPLTEKRESCLDPVPTCDKICSKRLKCGQPSKHLKNIIYFMFYYRLDMLSVCFCSCR